MRKLFSLIIVAVVSMTALQLLATPLAAQSFDDDFQFGENYWDSNFDGNDLDSIAANQAETVQAVGGLSAGLLLLMCCVVLVWIGISLAIAFFIYRDAKKVGVYSPSLTAGLIAASLIFSGFSIISIGLILALYGAVIRPQAKQLQESK